MKSAKPKFTFLIFLFLASVAAYSFLSVESNRAQLLQSNSKVERITESSSKDHRSVVLPEAKITQRILDFAASVIFPR